MSFGIKKFGFLVISLSTFCSQSFGYQVCSPEYFRQSNMHKSGFFLDSNELNILKTKRPLDRNKALTASVIKARVIKSIKNTRAQLASITDDRLASLITRAVGSVGVDFQMISSMIYQETKYCHDRHNESSAASGCTQFTTAGLNELKHQFGLMGSKHHAAGTPEIMKGLVKKYFTGEPGREKTFYNWLGSSTTNMQAAFRGRGNFDIDILAGALLLKVYLSTKGGRYYDALVQFNGDNTIVRRGRTRTPYKNIYASEIQLRATKISLDETTCVEAAAQTEQMINNACDLFGEDPLTCSDALTEPAQIQNDLI